MSVIDTMQKRISCRTYRRDSVAPEIIDGLRRFMMSNAEGPFGSRLRFDIFEFDHMNRDEIRACGTYGVIKGARHYIAGAVVKQPYAMEDFGYGMEKMVLQATALGLGTCWLGGTFKRSGFAAKLQLAEGELLPAVTPIGYASDKKSVVDRVFRFSAGSHKRKPWHELFFNQDGYALPREAAGPYETALECVRIGPSASNKQPWRIIMDDGGKRFHFFLERTPGYSGVYGDIQLQNVDMGIAMCHFELSVREIGLHGYWQSDDPKINSGRTDYIASWES